MQTQINRNLNRNFLRKWKNIIADEPQFYLLENKRLA